MPFEEWWDQQPRISGSGKDVARAVWHAAVAEQKERDATLCESAFVKGASTHREHYHAAGIVLAATIREQRP